MWRTGPPFDLCLSFLIKLHTFQCTTNPVDVLPLWVHVQSSHWNGFKGDALKSLRGDLCSSRGESSCPGYKKTLSQRQMWLLMVKPWAARALLYSFLIPDESFPLYLSNLGTVIAPMLLAGWDPHHPQRVTLQTQVTPCPSVYFLLQSLVPLLVCCGCGFGSSGSSMLLARGK